MTRGTKRDVRPAQGRLRGRRDGPVRTGPRSCDPARWPDRTIRRTGSPTGCGGPAAAAGSRFPAIRPSRCRSSTPATWRGWSSTDHRRPCRCVPRRRPSRSGHHRRPHRRGAARGRNRGQDDQRAGGDHATAVPADHDDWSSQQRSPARARAAGMPATPLEVTAGDVLAWDRQRGEPPLTGGFSQRGAGASRLRPLLSHLTPADQPPTSGPVALNGRLLPGDAAPGELLPAFGRVSLGTVRAGPVTGWRRGRRQSRRRDPVRPPRSCGCPVSGRPARAAGRRPGPRPCRCRRPQRPASTRTGTSILARASVDVSTRSPVGTAPRPDRAGAPEEGFRFPLRRAPLERAEVGQDAAEVVVAAGGAEYPVQAHAGHDRPAGMAPRASMRIVVRPPSE